MHALMTLARYNQYSHTIKPFVNQRNCFRSLKIISEANLLGLLKVG